MKEEVSEYYKGKGFSVVYVAINKEPRRVAVLRKPDGTTRTMSYAKYLYTSHYKCDIAEGDQVDHMNGDKMDDRIENLQILSRRFNNLRDRQGHERIIRICPVCGKEFIYIKRDLCSHPNPCCSRKCGGIKSRQTYMNNKVFRSINVSDR